MENGIGSIPMRFVDDQTKPIKASAAAEKIVTVGHGAVPAVITHTIKIKADAAMAA
jgi:hypothetical protein